MDSGEREKECIVKGTFRDLWDALKRQKSQWEGRQAPVMMAGPFFEADAINCLLKPVRDATKRLPDELHFGEIHAIEIPGERVRITFERDDFPDSALFWQVVGELIETMKEAGLEPAQSVPERLPHPDKRNILECVKELWIDGQTDKEISEALFIGEATVKRNRYVQGLKSKKRKNKS